MPDPILQLKKQGPRRDHKGKVSEDFTLYLDHADGIPKDWNRLHDPNDPKSSLVSKDAQGPVEFQSEILSGRIHAAPSFEQNYYAVTFRSLEDPDKALPPGNDYEKIEDALPVVKPWAASLCDLLYDVCFGRFGASPATGLILFAGGTGTGKTTFLNGILRRYFNAERYAVLNAKRRPHVVVLGDPVETYFYDKAQSKDLRKIAEIQREPGALRPFDFTARELGKDSPSLKACLTDALRETPSAVVISELRADEDYKAALDFAATGHLVLATSHTTTLADALGRLFKAYGAAHPAGRAEVAQRVLAVIHHRVIESEDNFKGADPNDNTSNVPAIWRGNSEGMRNLIADGLTSLVASAPAGLPNESGTLGRYWVASQLESSVMQPLADRLKWLQGQLAVPNLRPKRKIFLTKDKNRIERKMRFFFLIKKKALALDLQNR